MIPKSFRDENTTSDLTHFGGAHNDLARDAWPAHLAKLRAERLAKTNRRAELGRSARPLALTGRDNLTDVWKAAPPAAPVEHKETAQELHARVVAQMEIVKAELAEIAKALGRKA